MLSDLKSTLERMNGEGYFDTLLSRPLSDWAPQFKPLLGESILPAQNRPNNKYTETGVKYRSVVANDGSRYSPAQKKGNAIVGKVEVDLTDQDIAAEFSSEDYDNALAVANVNAPATNTGNPTMDGVIAITNWYAAMVVHPLMVKREVMRWQSIVDAVVKLRGDNGYSEDLPQSNPDGHRVAAGGAFSNDAYDPFEDIFARMEFMAAKGYGIGRIITSRTVAFKMLNNAKVKAAIGGYINVGAAGALVGVSGRQTMAKLNDYFNQYGLPGIEIYDLQFQTQLASDFYLKRDVMVFLATTARDVTIDRGDNEPVILRDVMGYQGVGRPAGASAPGIMQVSQYEPKKPPRMASEAWQTTFPVVTEPEGITVINGIT